MNINEQKYSSTGNKTITFKIAIFSYQIRNVDLIHSLKTED